jgi:hypothetical protein
MSEQTSRRLALLITSTLSLFLVSTSLLLIQIDIDRIGIPYYMVHYQDVIVPGIVFLVIGSLILASISHRWAYHALTAFEVATFAFANHEGLIDEGYRKFQKLLGSGFKVELPTSGLHLLLLGLCVAFLLPNILYYLTRKPLNSVRTITRLKRSITILLVILLLIGMMMTKPNINDFLLWAVFRNTGYSDLSMQTINTRIFESRYDDDTDYVDLLICSLYIVDRSVEPSAGKIVYLGLLGKNFFPLTRE